MKGTLSHRGFEYSFQLTGRRSNELSPMLFLSGAFQSMHSWRRFEASFASKTRVAVVDLPGAGSSAVLPSSYGLDFLAESVEHLLQATGLERVYLVSSSYGSPIAYRFAQMFPNRVSSLVLAGVMSSIPDDERNAIEASIALLESNRLADFAAFTERHLLCNDPDKTVRKRDVAGRVLRRCLKHMDDVDRERYLSNSRRLLQHAPLDLSAPPDAPTFIFTGAHDVFTTPAACREMAMRLGAWYTTIDEADHLFHLEQFETTVELLNHFATNELTSPIAGCAPIEHFHRAEPLQVTA